MPWCLFFLLSSNTSEPASRNVIYINANKKQYKLCKNGLVLVLLTSIYLLFWFLKLKVK